MSRPINERDKQLVWQWRTSADAVARIRREELANRSAAAHRQAVWDLAQLGGMLPPDPNRQHTSGLVEMQRLFALLRARGRR